ncbi:MAG: radical SAM protein [Deltaproteobacteria bacterium]|nr:radical SAM protein [Deltaproteobacteria bacterium]
MSPTLDPASLYRLPWSLNDNVLAWLEPTKRCNLACVGCYSRNDPTSDKPLEVVRRDIDAIVRQRKTHSLSIAGGDPLVYPHIVELVRIVRRDYGLEPVINTNGLALTPGLLGQLKAAGLHGITFHIDSTQRRPHWKRDDELSLCELRERYARMVASVGGITCAFNATITRDTLQHVPALVDWAQRHIDIVHNMVFILFRTTRTDDFDYFAHGAHVDMQSVVYLDQDRNPAPIRATEVVDLIRQRQPDFQPCAYLGGTKDARSFKWLLTGRLGTADTIYGYVGPRTMELIQTTHHALTGRYFAYAPPSALRAGRGMMAAFSPFDPSVRRAAKAYARDALARRRAPPVHFQSILVIQPIDMMPDGEMNMCDGCPDMTVLDGELVWSCRLDERVEHGCFLTAAPRRQEPTA